nr:modification methylase ngomiv [Quercus suber]
MIDIAEDEDLAAYLQEIHLQEDDLDALNDVDIGDDDPGNNVHAGISIPREYYEIKTARTERGVLLQPGSNVELKDGGFLRIKRLYKNMRTGETIIRGILLFRYRDHRIKHLNDMFPKIKNELCIMQFGAHPRCKETKLEDYMVDRPINEVRRLREIIFTNRLFGGTLSMSRFQDLSFRDAKDLRSKGYINQHDALNAKYVDDHAVLVARYISVQFSGRQGEKGWTGALLRLRERHSDPGKGIPDAALVYWWRELAMYGKAPSAFPPGYMHDLTKDEEPVGQRNTEAQKSGREHSTDRSNMSCSKAPQPRLHFDVCAGAGGAATGVQMAKSKTHVFKIAFLLDEWSAACSTLRRAFPEATILLEDIHKFCTKNDGIDYRVATAHISFPCQPYSCAHTRLGVNDDRNRDTGYSTEPILRKIRARHLTFEQTKGIVSMKTKNKGAFSKMIHQLTTLQFNVRWKIVNAADHVNAHARERLIVFASAPGEPLAAFAPPRREPVTVLKDILTNVPRDVEPHMQQHTARRGLPHDWNVPLKFTITTGCSALNDLHPSGLRGYTMQELAQLAGFPWWRLFAEGTTMTDLRRMIGNAVPCEMIKDQYLQIHKSLDEGDAEMARWLGTANTVDATRTTSSRGHMYHSPIELDADHDIEMLDTAPPPSYPRRDALRSRVIIDVDSEIEPEYIIVD